MSETGSDEAQIRQTIERRTQTFDAGDVDTLVSLYDLDALLYEVLPLLTYTGADVRESTKSWFNGYKTKIG